MEHHTKLSDGFDLHPASIVAFGPSAAPVERLIGLQSVIATAVGWLANLTPPDLRLPRAFALRRHTTRQGEL